MARSKVKSRSHHDVAHLQPLTNVLPRINFLHLTVSEIKPSQDFIGQGHYGKVKGQIKVTSLRCTPTHPNQCPYQISTSYTLQFPRYSPDKIFKLKVTTARSKVKSRSHHDVAHLHPLTNVPTKYQLPTPYGFSDTGRTTFFPPPQCPDSPKVCGVKIKVTSPHITLTFSTNSLPSINFLHITVFEILPRDDFKHQGIKFEGHQIRPKSL